MPASAAHLRAPPYGWGKIERAMIPRTLAPAQPSLWRRELARAVTDPAELLRLLGLDATLLAPALRAAEHFGLRVPRGYVARMRPGDPADPLLRQVLPLAEEESDAAGFVTDPVGDLQAMAAPGVLHKYRGRVLLTTTGACAVHCRYCFRRHFPYADANPAAGHWRAALEHIAADAAIEEVILSGGDPLTLADDRLAALVRALAEVPHVMRVRVHTRLPIVLPERVTDELCAALTATRLAGVVVVHANHPNEIDESVVQALTDLHAAGIVLLNQSVLLRGVNDDSGTLCALSEALFAARVLPYYLHLLDPVRGALHFDIERPRARRLWQEMQARLPGYLVPRLVQEVPGAPAKTIVA